MKRGLIITLIIVLVVIVLAVVGYLIIHSQNSPYKLTSTNVMNPVDFITPGGIKQIAEGYTSDNINFNVRIMQFSNEQDAIDGISKMEELNNPAMIGINGKYVKYKEAAGEWKLFYYKSGKDIIYIQYNGDKTFGDNFVYWFYSKYPNQ
jgi:hypothetical protein